MVEREAQRARETEAEPVDLYESSYKEYAEARRRAKEGRVVVKGNERPWKQGRQGRLKHYVHPALDVAVDGWAVFIHDIRTHSGKHCHQGGLCIYVLEGKGWTTVDGVRYDWEEGDLILLPIKPKGVEHQHFNAEPGKSCKWLAMIYKHYFGALGSEFEQREISPDAPGTASHA